MINAIYTDEVLHHITRNSLEEEGIEVEIGKTLLDENDDLQTELIAILKPDDFYNSKNFAMAPKSVDGVIATQNTNRKYNLYVVELKSSKLKHIKKSDIQEKFNNTFTCFFSADFSHIFLNTSYEFENLNLWLVCDPFGIQKKCAESEDLALKIKTVASRLRGVMSEYSNSLKPVSFRNQTTVIRLCMSPPTIELDGFTDLLA